MAVVMYDTPNDRYTSGDITPPWNSWANGFTEMICNQSSPGAPNISAPQTDMALLERCARVLHQFCDEYQALSWKNLATGKVYQRIQRSEWRIYCKPWYLR
jgi:hypothetical protein